MQRMKKSKTTFQWNSLIPSALCGRPLLPLALALIVGILIESGRRMLSLPISAILIAAVFAAAAVLLCALTRLRYWQPLLLLMLALGIVLCAGEYAALSAWPYGDGDRVQLTGRVLTLNTGEDDRYSLRLSVETLDGQPFDCADVMVYAQGQAPAYGSTVAVTGECYIAQEYQNAGSFSYNRYLRQQGICATVSTYYDGQVTLVHTGPRFSLLQVGAWLRSGFQQAAASLPREQQGLLYGVFLGDSSGINDQYYDAMQLSGMLHLFAVSGLHVGYIASIALILGGKGFMHRRRRFTLTMLLLLLYVSMTGLSASILRASVMILLLLLSDLLVENSDPVSALALAAILCLLVRPLWLFSAGFQLSFVAVCGLLALTPLLTRLFAPRRLGQSFAAAIAASIATMPLIVYYFGYVSWAGWLLSPLAVLAAGLAVALCFIATPVAVFLPTVAGFLLQMAGLIMAFLAEVASWAASLPFMSSLIGRVSLPFVLCFYVFLLFWPWLLQHCSKRVAVLALSAVTLLFVLAPRLSHNRAFLSGQVRAEVVFLDVGQGDCAFIRTADGRTVLIDGGGNLWSPGSIGNYVVLPYLRSQGVTQLDLIVSSHPDADHCDGLLTVLDKLPVSTLLYADCFDNALQSSLLAAAQRNGSTLMPARAGTTYRLGDSLLFRVYSPAQQVVLDENDASLVVEVSCGEVDFLFTGDATGTILADLQATYDIEAEIVKLPHHGSKTGYDEDFYAHTGAKALVISVGAENSYGHPADIVVEYWQDKAELYRTDEDGAIHVYTDGSSWTIYTEN